MSAPSNLPAALFHHAAAGREEPWLFRAEGWDWRWHSWGEVAGWVSAWAERLSGLPAGSRAAFSYAPHPRDVALDLALQAAGLVPVPVSVPMNGGREGCGARFWVEIAGEELRVTELSPAGSAALETPPDLIGLAERVQAEIRGALRKSTREIVVLGGPLERAEERAMLSWAAVAGAAVVLEPDPALRVATAAWVRPTVFHGTAAELARLRTWVEKEARGLWRRGPGLPFRRLGTVLATEEMPEAEKGFWEGRGVWVGRVPGGV
jgi:acyl-CoA synthetase (AMP-forming)/AMP-acid ligase II